MNAAAIMEAEANQLWEEIEGAKQSDEIVAAVKQLFAGRHPGIQGAVLAELVAIWLAGHDPRMREMLLSLNIHAIKQMVKQIDEDRRREGKDAWTD